MNLNIHYTLHKLAEIIDGTLSGKSNDNDLNHLLLDSRKLITPNSTVFFSLKNTPKKSLSIIKELYEKQVLNFVIDFQINPSDFPHATFIFVQNTLTALQTLAENHRNNFTIPIIGITGSNGKTIVKEWLNQLLQPDFNIARSPRSYNSQIGVPLSLLQLKRENNLGIFEAGISEPGEMESIEKIMHPTIGVFTNIGDAHSEGFNNLEEKTVEKLKLFANANELIYCSDYIIIQEVEKAVFFPQIKHFTWGSKETDSLHIIKKTSANNKTIIQARYQTESIEISIPFSDKASIENAIHCWCILLLFGLNHDVISKRMLHLTPVEMRLELKQGINNCSIINDCYSSDLQSLQIGIDFLLQQKQHGTHTVILSDLLETGMPSELLYKEISNQLNQKKVNRLIGIGPELFNQKSQFACISTTNFYTSLHEFKKDFYSLHFHNEAILLKGARVFEFEQISSMLEQKVHETILSINLSAVTHNLKQYKNILNYETKIMAMVKAFSYGSGAFEIARVLQYNKVEYLAVAYVDEGVTLRKAGITLPIMIMNPGENSFNTIVQYFLEPEIYSFSLLQKLENYLESQGLEEYPIHIKIDTGMHRLGFDPGELNELSDRLKLNRIFHVQSVFTHLIASNDLSKKDLSIKQFTQFKMACSILEDKLNYTFIKHIANTSAISLFPEMQMDMVRAGIGIYGIDSNMAMYKKLKNVTTLTTTISQIKEVKANETVGYGGEFKLIKDSRIATIRIGYADGFHRVFGNGVGKVRINNLLLPVVGNVCMDMTMIDITGIDGIKEGDEVEIFGNHLPIQNLAEWSKTISYEIMTGVSQRVKRIYFEE